MIVKLKIECTLKVLTGLHIGDNNGFAPIGALDNPVIRDTYSGDPMIPGSSLKGKMRTLLARSMQKEGDYILPSCDKDDPRITRLFGDANPQRPHVARLQFSDCFLSNREAMLRTGGLTEVKNENTINRRTSVANPRSMERVVRGSEFKVVWLYTVDNPAELSEDMKTLSDGCKLLCMDYLGGSGTRGYGRIAMKDFKAECVFGTLPGNVTEESIVNSFKDVSDYAVQDL